MGHSGSLLVDRFDYIDPAVDAEKLAGLLIQLFKFFSVPVEVRCDEQIRPQIYTVSGTGRMSNISFNYTEPWDITADYISKYIKM